MKGAWLREGGVGVNEWGLWEGAWSEEGGVAYEGAWPVHSSLGKGAWSEEGGVAWGRGVACGRGRGLRKGRGFRKAPAVLHPNRNLHMQMNPAVVCAAFGMKAIRAQTALQHQCLPQERAFDSP